MAIVYVGLGSNLDDPRDQLERAFDDLDRIDGCSLLARSSLYQSKPMGPQDQPDFINGAAKLACTLAPNELLRRLQEIEHQHGRIRSERWGPRTLDLDILLFGNQEIRQPDLVVPHVGVTERPFVLQPLMEIDPELEIPGRGRISELIVDTSADELVKLGTEI